MERGRTEKERETDRKRKTRNITGFLVNKAETLIKVSDNDLGVPPIPKQVLSFHELLLDELCLDSIILWYSLLFGFPPSMLGTLVT